MAFINVKAVGPDNDTVYNDFHRVDKLEKELTFHTFFANHILRRCGFVEA